MKKLGENKPCVTNLHTCPSAIWSCVQIPNMVDIFYWQGTTCGQPCMLHYLALHMMVMDSQINPELWPPVSEISTHSNYPCDPILTSISISPWEIADWGSTSTWWVAQLKLTSSHAKTVRRLLDANCKYAPSSVAWELKPGPEKRKQKLWGTHGNLLLKSGFMELTSSSILWKSVDWRTSCVSPLTFSFL